MRQERVTFVWAQHDLVVPLVTSIFYLMHDVVKDPTISSLG